MIERSLLVLLEHVSLPVDGKAHLLNFEYGGTGPQMGAEPKLVTSKGIGLGSTVEELKNAYGTRIEVFQDEVTQRTAFRLGDQPHQIVGFLSGDGSGAEIEMIQGGAVCGE